MLWEATGPVTWRLGVADSCRSGGGYRCSSLGSRSPVEQTAELSSLLWVAEGPGSPSTGGSMDRPGDHWRGRFWRPATPGRWTDSRLAKDRPCAGSLHRVGARTRPAWRRSPVRRRDGDGLGTRCHPRRGRPHHQRTVRQRGAPRPHRFPGDAALRRRGPAHRSVRPEGPHPIACAAEQDATSGRGLATVDALAASWGARPEGAGKVVWAEIGPRGFSGTGEGRNLSDSVR